MDGVINAVRLIWVTRLSLALRIRIIDRGERTLPRSQSRLRSPYVVEGKDGKERKKERKKNKEKKVNQSLDNRLVSVHLP